MPGGKPTDVTPANRLGSKARCDALLKKASQIPDGVIFWFILTAGFTKESPSRPTPEQRHSIAEEMSAYIESKKNGLTRVPLHLGWGTYEETLLAIRLMKELDSEKNTVYVSTNLGHMPRVRLCWFFLKPKGWKVHFLSAQHSFTPKEWCQETTKFFIYLYHLLFKR